MEVDEFKFNQASSCDIGIEIGPNKYVPREIPCKPFVLVGTEYYTDDTKTTANSL